MTAPTPLWFDDFGADVGVEVAPVLARPVTPEQGTFAQRCGVTSSPSQISAAAENQAVNAGDLTNTPGPECPDCRSTESPRLVTFDGIDSGTGEQIHEERFRCSCGFVGEENEFQAGAAGRGPYAGRPVRLGKAHGEFDSPAPASISPRIERGTEDGPTCPF